MKQRKCIVLTNMQPKSVNGSSYLYVFSNHSIPNQIMVVYGGSTHVRLRFVMLALIVKPKFTEVHSKYID